MRSTLKRLLLAILGVSLSASAQVTLTAHPPPYGWQVMTGAVRTIPVFPSGSGATTKLINWSATGATLSCTSNCPAVVTVTITALGGTCSVTGSVGSYVLHSTSDVILTAQSVDDTSKTVTIPFHVCDTSADAFVAVEPSYQQAYQGQDKTLQSYVIGNTDERVTWAITTSPSGGNATLADTTNRDTVIHSGTVTGRYVLTATSVANGGLAGTAIVYVSPNTLPTYSATHGRTPNRTQPIECYHDPALTGTYYDIGAGHTYPDIKSVNFQTWTAGSIACIFNTDTTGLAPSTYHNAACVRSTGTPTQPLYIGGVPDSLGNLPIVDGENATENAADTACTSTDGLGAFKMTGTNSGFSQGYGLGSVGPDYLTIAGLEIRNFQVGLPYTTSAGASATYSNPSGIWLGSGQHVLMEGLDLENVGWGVLANSNTAGGGRRFTQFHQFKGSHINNFSQPGSFSMHALYLEGLHSLVEGNLIENPQMDLTGNTPNYDNGDFIKVRGGDSIIRYNLFRGIVGDHIIEYPDMEDTYQFVGVDMNLGVPGDTTCGDSVWCTFPTTNITLGQLTENAEALAKDAAYGDVMGNQLPITSIQYGSQSAPDECPPCTNMADRQGNLTFFNNTVDKAQQVIATINYNTGGFTATDPIYSQLSVKVFNNVLWSDSTTTGGGTVRSHPFVLNYDGTMVASFLTNMFASGIMNITTPISGGSPTSNTNLTGWGNFTNTISWPGTTPLNAHMTGISSPNFLTTSTLPYNGGTFAPITSSPLFSAGTTTPVAGMPCRYQPDAEWGYMTARTDNCSTIGAVQSGDQPTATGVVITPASATFPIPPPTTAQEYFASLSWSSALIPPQQVGNAACGWSSSNGASMLTFDPCNPVFQVFNGAMAGSGMVTTSYLGFNPTTPFTVGGGAPTLVSMALTPTSLSFVTGGSTQTLTCTATLSDSSTEPCSSAGSVGWSTSNSGVATVASGVVTPIGAGTANISAAIGGVTSNSVPATVTNPTAKSSAIGTITIQGTVTIQ